MKISTKGRYALRMMLDLAQNDTGGYIALRDISARQNVSVKYLEQIVTLLSRAGYLKSVRGSQGGYKLSRKPAEYRVGDILRVTEGKLVPVACLEGDTVDCERAEECITLPFWQGLQEVIENYVDKTTLADLLDRERKSDPCSLK